MPCVCMLVAQLCLILCNPVDCSPLGSSTHGIFQASILEWVAISFSRESSHQGIASRSPTLQADSSPSEPPGKPENTGVGCHVLLLRDHPSPGIEPGSPALQADSLPVELSGTTSMLFSRIISNTKKEDSLLCLMTL